MWDGWNLVDQFVYSNGGLSLIKNNQYIPGLDNYVSDFYSNLWYKNYMDKIISQDVANILFDFIVNSGSTIAVKHVQKLVGVTQDGIIGNETINAINNQNPQTLFNAIKTDRASFYTKLATSSSNYAQFLKGWLSRLTSFNYSGVTVKTVGLGIFILFAVIFTFLSLKNK
jgi:hypothetical protein